MIQRFRHPLPVRFKYILGVFLILLGGTGAGIYYAQEKSISQSLQSSAVTNEQPVTQAATKAVTPSPSPSVTVPAVQGKIKISTATQAELESLPTIGPVKAKAIIDYRTKNGFKSVNDLQKVKGIGPKTMEQLRPLIEL